MPGGRASQAVPAAGGLDGGATPGAALDDPLSEREREVLALLADGQSNKLIARAPDLSLHTVKRHVANILRQAGRGQPHSRRPPIGIGAGQGDASAQEPRAARGRERFDHLYAYLNNSFGADPWRDGARFDSEPRVCRTTDGAPPGGCG